MIDQYIYSDIDMDFVENQSDGYVTNENSVWQALTSLFNTRVGERIFNPNVSLDLETFLGEFIDISVAMRIFTFLVGGIPMLEPRFKLQTKSCNIIPDTSNHSYYLSLIGSVVGFSSGTFEYNASLL